MNDGSTYWRDFEAVQKGSILLPTLATASFMVEVITANNNKAVRYV